MNKRRTESFTQQRDALDTIKAGKKVMQEPFSVRIGRKISLNMKHGFNRDGNKKGFLERKLQTALKKNKNVTESQIKIE